MMMMPRRNFRVEIELQDAIEKYLRHYCRDRESAIREWEGDMSSFFEDAVDFLFGEEVDAT